MSWPVEFTTGGKPPRYTKKRVDINLENFRIAVDSLDGFPSDLPRIRAKWSTGKIFNEQLHDIRKVPFDYINEPYFAMIMGAYVASYHCGIGMNCLQNGNPIVKSLVNYHFYYWTRTFMTHPEYLSKYYKDIPDIKRHIPTSTFDWEATVADEDGNYGIFQGHKEYSDRDYQWFIAEETSGLTKVGQELFQETIQSFVYSVLGAQASLRWAIVGHGANSFEVQKVFRRIVGDTVLKAETETLVTDMRTSIVDTGVRLDMAIVPGVQLVPSNMIILDKSVPGFNNVLQTASKTMTFGLNNGVNPTRKRVPGPEPPVETVGDLPNPSGPRLVKTVPKKKPEPPVELDSKPKPKQVDPVPDNHPIGAKPIVKPPRHIERFGPPVMIGALVATGVGVAGWALSKTK